MFNRKFLVLPFTYSPIEAGVSLSGSTVIKTGVKFGTLGKSSAINKIKLGDWKHVSQSYKVKKIILALRNCYGNEIKSHFTI